MSRPEPVPPGVDGRVVDADGSHTWEDCGLVSAGVMDSFLGRVIPAMDLLCW